MSSKFQLLKIPTKVFKLVLKNLEIIDIISLSFTSTKTRKYLEPVKRWVETLDVHIVSNNFNVTVWSPDSRTRTSFYITRLGTSGLSFTDLPTDNESQNIWDFPTVNLRLWLQDFLRIFNPPRISNLVIIGRSGREEFAQSLLDLFQGFKIGGLETGDLVVVRKLGQHADCLRWSFGGHPPQKSLIQNMYNFDATSGFALKITIDDLLMSNMRTICLYSMYFPLKDCNRFLKCWIKGSIPNLEYLNVQRSVRFEQVYGVTIDEDNFEEKLFKGIPYHKFETSGPYRFMEVNWNVNLTDGYEIRRKNGQKALVEFKRGSFQLVVPRD